MRIVLQRVSKASVSIDRQIKGAIGEGLVLLVGVHLKDTEDIVEWMGSKIARLRIFEDEKGKMNRSVSDICGGLLIVSQFTLYADTRKGTRPGFSEAAPPETAEPLYNKLIDWFRNNTDLQIETGTFGAMMDIELVNKGPVTIIIDK